MLPTGTIGLPLTKVTPKEIDLVGSFRVHGEFASRSRRSSAAASTPYRS